MTLHPTLARQLHDLSLSPDMPPSARSWCHLLEQVSRAYAEMEASSDPYERPLGVRLQALLQAIPDFLFLVDEQGCYLEMLAGDPARLLIPVEVLLGRRFDEVMQEPIAARLMQALHATLADGEVRTVEYGLHRGDEERIYEGRMVRVTTGEAPQVLFLVRDVSASVESEGVARMLQTVLSQASEGIVIVRGQDRRVLYANDAVTDTLGYTPEELMAEGEGFLRHELDQALCDELCQLARNRDAVKKEAAIHDKEGGERKVWLSIDTLRNSAGEIDFFVCLLTDLTEIERSRQMLAYQAAHDSLTGLPNRTSLRERLGQALARARRHDASGAVLLLDLDRFKHINDSLGHGVGDEVLCQAAARIDGACREEDFVARLGGDEFVVVLEDLQSPTQAGRVAEKILQAFREPLRLKGEEELHVTPSIGVCVFPDDEEDADDLVRRADAAMYEAKGRGGNSFDFHHPDMTERARRHLEIERALRLAIAEDRLEVHYQPQFDLASGSLASMEALVRWRLPDGRLRPPGEFIGVAELSGLIVPLGYWVVEAVCRQIRAWHEAGLGCTQVAINVSARQLAEPAFAGRVSELLAQYGVPSTCVELEVTESIEVPPGSIRMRNIEQLREAGLRLAVDDFGTGHSSLANLKRFPLSALKIDQSFVQDVGRDPSDEAIIRAIIAMAKALGLETVAEGVEHELQLAFLRELGCDRVQGYLPGRPMPADEMAELLASRGTCCKERDGAGHAS